MKQEDTYVVRLTEAQVKLLRKLIGDKCLLVSRFPLDEDGYLKQQLFDVDKVLHSISQCF